MNIKKNIKKFIVLIFFIGMVEQAQAENVLLMRYQELQGLIDSIKTNSKSKLSRADQQTIDACKIEQENIMLFDMVTQEFSQFKYWIDNLFTCGAAQERLHEELCAFLTSNIEPCVKILEKDTTLKTLKKIEAFFVYIKKMRLKVEVLSIGTLFVGQDNAILIVPLSSGQRRQIMESTLKLLFDMLRTAIADQVKQAEILDEQQVCNVLLHQMHTLLPDRLQVVWFKKLLYSRGYISADNLLKFYDILHLDVYKDYKLECDAFFSLLDAQACYKTSNKIIREDTRKSAKLCKQKMQKIIDDTKNSNNNAGIIARALLTKVVMIQKMQENYDKPGFSKVTDNPVIAVRDRLKELVCENSGLNKQQFLKLFERFNAIIDSYEHALLNGTVQHADLKSEVGNLVLALRVYRPGGLVGSWSGALRKIWSDNGVEGYVLDKMREVLQTIDPGVKEETLLSLILANTGTEKKSSVTETFNNLLALAGNRELIGILKNLYDRYAGGSKTENEVLTNK
ncbi:MAG: hypothetical protein ABH827_06250 [bacterium]